MRIVIVPNEHGSPAGKLADAELHFDARDGQLLAGLKVIGFSIWESQWPTKNPTYPHWRVTLPARPYEVNGERRSFNLVRPVQESQVRGVETAATAALTNAILEAYDRSLNTAPARVVAAQAVARQVYQAAQQPPPPRPAPRPQPAQPVRRAPAADNGRYPLRAPVAPPEPPPHTDDDYWEEHHGKA